MYYSGLTKTQAKEQFGFTDSEIKKIRCTFDRNAMGGKVFVYQKCDLEAYAIAHYGSVEAAIKAAEIRKSSGSAKGRAAAAEMRRNAVTAEVNEISSLLDQIFGILIQTKPNLKDEDRNSYSWAHSPPGGHYVFYDNYARRCELIRDDLGKVLNRATTEMVSSVHMLLADARDLLTELRLAARRAPDCQHFTWRHVLRKQGLCTQCAETADRAAEAAELVRQKELKEAAQEQALALGLPELSGSSSQIRWAVTIRHEFIMESTKSIGQDDTLTLLRIPRARDAAFWINNRTMIATRMAVAIKTGV